ncbi:hypothetical protein QH494_26030 [Sphingomonas sp. AR_OL41]|uniref:hypothetical protein n=1 Tax=Sphingomonas sp. AR_OL41 TaxID=3042729 RepID=UPI002480B051|nr:hypothetical protein [Sphingomonas sp. AR_OL41]MDH7975659.1 hypothetical protein [Sphingomonas sp. AR_OL41]
MLIDVFNCGAAAGKKLCVLITPVGFRAVDLIGTAGTGNVVKSCLIGLTGHKGEAAMLPQKSGDCAVYKPMSARARSQPSLSAKYIRGIVAAKAMTIAAFTATLGAPKYSKHAATAQALTLTRSRRA